MSRVLLLSLDEGQVVSSCLASNVSISAIESLPAGGTRLVCASSDGAATMKRKLKSQLITGTVTRNAFRPKSPLW